MKHKRYQIIVTFRRYLLGCMALVLLYAVLHQGFSPMNIAGIMRIWGDAFVISSVILLEITGVLWLDRSGYADWIAYSLHLSRFLLSHKKDESFVNYYDYKSLREHNIRLLWPGIVTAFICFLLGVILSTLFL